MKVVVVYGLPSLRIMTSGHGVIDEDSAEIARHVVAGLRFAGYEAENLAVSEAEIATILMIKADCVFNLIEWSGLDSPLTRQAFGYFRKLNLPVTGATEANYTGTDNKVTMKKMLLENKLCTPNYAVLVTGSEPVPPRLKYPVIVKPSLEHCSVGLDRRAVAGRRGELRAIIKRQIKQFGQPVLVEEFVAGRELLVYLLEVEGKVRVLPIEEVKFAGGDPLAFQTYQAKWVEGHPDYNSTEVEAAKLQPEHKRAVEELCKRAFAALGFRGYARFDLRLDDGVPYLLETNANPSVYDAEEEGPINREVIPGITFPDYLDAIVKAALYHYERGEVI